MFIDYSSLSTTPQGISESGGTAPLIPYFDTAWRCELDASPGLPPRSRSWPGLRGERRNLVPISAIEPRSLVRLVSLQVIALTELLMVTRGRLGRDGSFWYKTVRRREHVNWMLFVLSLHHSDCQYSCNVGYLTGSINSKDWTQQAQSTVLAKFATYFHNPVCDGIRK